jgi:ankyrin repeat protein
MLSYASELGITPLVACILDNTDHTGTDARGGDDRTPLWRASSAGYATAVELLLGTKKVDVNNKDQNREMPWYAAAAKRYIIVVQLLLNEGADVDVNGGHHGYAFLASLALNTSSHNEVARMLLNRST